MRRTTSAVLLASALVFTACSSSGDGDDDATTTTAVEGGSTTTAGGGGGDTTTTTAAVADDPDQAIADAVDATLASTSFAVDNDANLEIGAQTVRLQVEGGVHYEDAVADIVLSIDQDGSPGEMMVRADGDKVWISAEGTGVPAIPGPGSWVEGDAVSFSEADSFSTEGLVGVLLGLRGSDGAELGGDDQELDGVETTHYTTTLTYAEAVAGAGDQAEDFRTALTLTGADESELIVDLWIGDDGVVRRMDLDIEAPAGIPIDGTYELLLTDVGAEIEAPDAPDSGDITTGAAAEEFFASL